MFEKYHALNVGYPGGGGEYIVQEGFGWTNGVVLWILDKFGSNVTAPTQCLRIEREIIFKRDRETISTEEETIKNSNNSTKRFGLIVLSIIFKIFFFFKIV